MEIKHDGLRAWAEAIHVSFADTIERVRARLLAASVKGHEARARGYPSREAAEEVAACQRELARLVTELDKLTWLAPATLPSEPCGSASCEGATGADRLRSRSPRRP